MRPTSSRSRPKSCERSSTRAPGRAAADPRRPDGPQRHHEARRTRVLDDIGVELIGAGLDAIEAAEDRGRFKAIMDAHRNRHGRRALRPILDEAARGRVEIGYPVMVRPSYILGGGGRVLPTTRSELRTIVSAGLDASPVREVLVEESLLGWKEYELEVMRDGRTTRSSCAPSRTSIRWGSTPATRSRLRRP